jgi:hypothetical protein
MLIQNFFKNHFLAYQDFRCYFFKICKIAKFYPEFQYVAKIYKRILYFILLLPNLAKLSYGWSSIGQHHKIEKKATLPPHYPPILLAPIPLKKKTSMVFLLTFTKLLAINFQPCLLASFFTTQGNTHDHRK